VDNHKDHSIHYLYRVGSHSRSIGRPPHFYRGGELLSTGCTYGSVYAVRAEDAQAIQEAGTAAGFKGTVWSQRLWVDFDTEDSAQVGRTRLKEMGLDHVVYTTGGRGCHIGILRDSAPSHVLPMQDKLWVRENLPGADLSLYWHLHLIRLPGTLHERTGLPKRLLYTEAGRGLVLPPYEPTEDVPAGRGAEWAIQRSTSLFQDWEVVRKVTDQGGSSGDRHRKLLSLALTLKERGDVAPDEMRWLLGELNRTFDEPKGQEEIEGIVRWSYGQ
jgi:hypothetical protein